MPLIGEPSPLTADDKPADIYVSGVVCRMLLDQFHCLDICIVVCEAILALERRHARSIYRHVPPFNSTTPRHARVRKVPLRYFFNSNFPRYSVRYGTRLSVDCLFLRSPSRVLYRTELTRKIRKGYFCHSGTPSRTLVQGSHILATSLDARL